MHQREPLHQLSMEYVFLPGSDWRDSGLAEAAGCDGSHPDWALNDSTRRTTRAATALTSEQVDEPRAVEESHWRQAGADLGGSVHRLMAAGRSITL